MSQNSKLLKHFQAGGTLTSAEAPFKFSCERLAARVSELNKIPWVANIVGDSVKCHDGKYRTVYRAATAAPKPFLIS